MSVPATGTRRGVAAGCALGLASGWNIANLGAMASDLARAYGVGLAAIGLFTTALFVTHTGIQVPGGRISDRFGAVRAGIAGLALIALGDALALTTPEPAVALAARAITGAGTGLSFIAGNALVRESGGSPFAQGLFGGIGLGGGGLALAIVPLFEPSLDWRAPFWTSLAILAVAAGGLAAAGARRAPAPRAGGPRARGPGVFGDRRLYRLALLYSCTYGVAVITANWVVELLQRHTGLGDAAAGAVGALTLLLGIVTRPLGGWLLRRRPNGMLVWLRVALVAGAAGTLVAALAPSPVAAVVGAVLVGASAGLSFAPSFTWAAQARPDTPGAAVGLVNGFANALVLVGTPLVGLTFSLPGEGRVGFAVIAAAWLSALLALHGRGARTAAAAAQ